MSNPVSSQLTSKKHPSDIFFLFWLLAILLILLLLSFTFVDKDSFTKGAFVSFFYEDPTYLGEGELFTLSSSSFSEGMLRLDLEYLGAKPLRLTDFPKVLVEEELSCNFLAVEYPFTSLLHKGDKVLLYYSCTSYILGKDYRLNNFTLFYAISRLKEEVGSSNSSQSFIISIK